MSYYAQYTGRIRLQPSVIDVVNANADKLPFEDYDFRGNTLEVWGDDKYHEDKVYSFLHDIAPNTVSGNIEYTGEDGTKWRFNFRNGHWYEDPGTVVYDESAGTPI